VYRIPSYLFTPVSLKKLDKERKKGRKNGKEKREKSYYLSWKKLIIYDLTFAVQNLCFSGSDVS
jgi:hypothetical protein